MEKHLRLSGGEKNLNSTGLALVKVMESYEMRRMLNHSGVIQHKNDKSLE